MPCLGVILYAQQEVRIAGSLAKQFLANPAFLVGVLPCNTFMFARQIYQKERKEVPLHANCNFFVHNNMIFVKALRRLRRIPN